MARFSVFVTRSIPKAGIEMLRRECDVEVRSSVGVPSKTELSDGVRHRNALLCLLTDQIDADVISAGRELKVIANYAVGYDNVDVAAATKRGIMVTNTPGVLTETTADMAWALLMSIARRVVEADAFTRAGRFRQWEPELLLGGDIHGKTLGIVGLGRIGQAVARRAKGFEMKVLYTSRARKEPGLERELGVQYADLQTLLTESDYVTLHTPLTEETHHLIGEIQLRTMKRTAYLINTSRGPVVDEGALARALADGIIAGAGLDVYEQEPTVSSELLELPNVILTPHIGSASIDTRGKMSRMAAENILSARRGERPPNLVNPEVLG